jgi:hypothetical protein
MKKFLLFLFLHCIAFTLLSNAQDFNKIFGLSLIHEFGVGAFQISDSSYIMIGYRDPGLIEKFHISSSGVLLADTQISYASNNTAFIYKESDQYFYISSIGFIGKYDSSGTNIWIGNYPAYYALYIPLTNLNRLDIVSFPQSEKITLNQVDSANHLIRSDTMTLDSGFDYIPDYAAQLSDHSIIVVSKRDNDTISMGYNLLKCDTQGNELWRSDLPDDTFEIDQVIAFPDSGFVISGMTIPQTGDTSDIFLNRYDKNGNLIWNRIYFHRGNHFAFQLNLLPDNGFIIGCEGSDTATYRVSIFLYRADANGNLLWSKEFLPPHFSFFKSVYPTLDNGFLICGSADIGNNFDFWLIKTDSLGNTNTLNTGISEVASVNNSFQIYPNPSHDATIIYSSEEVLMKIFDSSGKMILMRSITGSSRIDTLTPGLYFVEVMDKSGVISVKKLIVK